MTGKRSVGSTEKRKQKHASEARLMPSCPKPSSSLASFDFVTMDIQKATHLQNEKEQEVGVGNFLELLKQVDRQEGKDIVLGGLDAVALWQ